MKIKKTEVKWNWKMKNEDEEEYMWLKNFAGSNILNNLIVDLQNIYRKYKYIKKWAVIGWCYIGKVCDSLNVLGP